MYANLINQKILFLLTVYKIFFISMFHHGGKRNMKQKQLMFSLTLKKSMGIYPEP